LADTGSVGIGTLSPAEKLHAVLRIHSQRFEIGSGRCGQLRPENAVCPRIIQVCSVDEGMARLDTDPIFRDVLAGECLMHLTPPGDASLYVAEVGPDYFVARARDGDPDVFFTWRLSAHRKGYDGIRL
jgi:hypothetical protein